MSRTSTEIHDARVYRERICTVVTVACDGADVRGRGLTMPSPFGLAGVCQFTAPYVLGYRAADGRSFG